MERIGFENVAVHVWDAAKLEEELVNTADVVIADVPCSGLGVIGKKPDIKFKMTKEAMAELVPLQRKILHTVQNYVKPGGVLMFSTCTVNRAENQDNVTWFLENHQEFETEDFKEWIPAEFHQAVKEGMMQLLPGQFSTDGFFIAKLRRKK